MALIEIVGAIKLEPSAIKSEPNVVEIYPEDVFQSSDTGEEDQNKKKSISDSKIAVDETKVKDECINEDDRKENDFCATENLRENERLVLNFNKQVAEVTNNYKPKENGSNKQINWAHVYRTSESTNCTEDQKKVKTVYGSSWTKPIRHEEYTFMSDTSIICNHCHREYLNMQTLTKHIKMLHRESSLTYHCPYCPYQSKWNLKVHILSQHKNENEINWFQCYQCDKKYRVKNRLVNHMQIHTGKIKESSATCPTCERVFCSRKRLKIHIRIYHEGKNHRCEKCSFTGQYLSTLRDHIEACHTDPSELSFHQCNKCDFKTRYRYLYARHCRKHGTSFFCDKCAFVTDNRPKFKLHENVHKEKIDDATLKYQCKKCEYKTYRQYSFKVHELNHLKPEEIEYFYCYHCKFKAKRKDNLKTHIMRHFKNQEVILQCFICNFGTNKRSALTRHIKDHQKPP